MNIHAGSNYFFYMLLIFTPQAKRNKELTALSKQ